MAVTELTNTWSLDPQLQDGFVRFSVPRGEEFLPEFVRRFDGQLLSISVRRPTLDDVFLDVTGRDIRDEEIDKATQLKKSIGDRHR